jgi:tetratricopeptide (TPR) repeat protein
MANVGEYSLPEVQGKTDADFAALLNRATEVGLLSPLITDHRLPFTGYYTIHPALPWYLRQLFARHYDGLAGRSSAEAALRAWVEAMGALGNYDHDQYEAGNREVIGSLALEEANLLHARRAARRHGWWRPVTSAMQGLQQLCAYQGRTAEWARLVAEITHEYCTADDGPFPGREDGYTLVMGYRVDLAHLYDRDLPAAAALQAKVATWDRQQAAPALALPLAAPLDAGQRHRIRTLGVSVFTLGQILMEQGSLDCVAAYEETIPYMQRIGDSAAEAIANYNLGRAYGEGAVPAIRDLDAAEAVYRRALALHAPHDALERSKCIKQIGMVHHERFDEACQRGEPAAVVIHHAQAAEQHYHQALALCPPSAVADLHPIHHQLGKLYAEVGATEPAREQFERAAQLCEPVGDHYKAGIARYGLAITFLTAAGREKAPAPHRDLLLRAAAYAQASLRDYQRYVGRAADMEALAQRLIEAIARAVG